MKNSLKNAALLCVGIILGATLFGGMAVYAASGIMAERSANTVYVDGRRVELEAYLIDGANYVKLRDVGEAVGFNVYWNGSVQIESGKPYTGEATVGIRIPQEATVPAASTIPDESAKANSAIFTGGFTREAYNALRQIVNGAEESGAVPMTDDTKQAMEKAAAATGLWPAYDVCSKSGGVRYFTSHYSDSYQEAAAFCQPLVDSVADKTDREKVRDFAFYVCDRLTYEANSTATPRTALSSMGVSKGNCMSYAYSFKFLCDMAGIPCIFVHSANHQWNEVYVDGQWWHVDVSAIDVGDDTVSRVYSHVLYDDNDKQGASYQQTEPMLTMFAKEALVPGSTK